MSQPRHPAFPFPSSPARLPASQPSPSQLVVNPQTQQSFPGFSSTSPYVSRSVSPYSYRPPSRGLRSPSPSASLFSQQTGHSLHGRAPPGMKIKDSRPKTPTEIVQSIVQEFVQKDQARVQEAGRQAAQVTGGFQPSQPQEQTIPRESLDSWNSAVRPQAGGGKRVLAVSSQPVTAEDSAALPPTPEEKIKNRADEDSDVENDSLSQGELAAFSLRPHAAPEPVKQASLSQDYPRKLQLSQELPLSQRLAAAGPPGMKRKLSSLSNSQEIPQTPPTSLSQEKFAAPAPRVPSAAAAGPSQGESPEASAFPVPQPAPLVVPPSTGRELPRKRIRLEALGEEFPSASPLEPTQHNRREEIIKIPAENSERPGREEKIEIPPRAAENSHPHVIKNVGFPQEILIPEAIAERNHGTPPANGSKSAKEVGDSQPAEVQPGPPLKKKIIQRFQAQFKQNAEREEASEEILVRSDDEEDFEAGKHRAQLYSATAQDDEEDEDKSEKLSESFECRHQSVQTEGMNNSVGTGEFPADSIPLPRRLFGELENFVLDRIQSGDCSANFLNSLQQTLLDEFEMPNSSSQAIDSNEAAERLEEYRTLLLRERQLARQLREDNSLQLEEIEQRKRAQLELMMKYNRLVGKIRNYGTLLTNLQEEGRGGGLDEEPENLEDFQTSAWILQTPRIRQAPPQTPALTPRLSATAEFDRLVAAKPANRKAPLKRLVEVRKPGEEQKAASKKMSSKQRFANELKENHEEDEEVDEE